MTEEAVLNRNRRDETIFNRVPQLAEDSFLCFIPFVLSLLFLL
jgi:hypothetical protein